MPRVAIGAPGWRPGNGKLRASPDPNARPRAKSTETGSVCAWGGFGYLCSGEVRVSGCVAGFRGRGGGLLRSPTLPSPRDVESAGWECGGFGPAPIAAWGG